MKKFNEIYVIGIDHGYGNMKTANCCFPTGVMKSDTEPTFVSDLLVWNGKYYSIGVGHKEFTADKFNDEDYYILTLAAIARELRRERITEASVFIAAGLPLTWVSEQKAEFKKYLLQHSEVAFTFRNTEYRIKIAGAEICPQGFAAIAERLGDFKGVNISTERIPEALLPLHSPRNFSIRLRSWKRKITTLCFSVKKSLKNISII